MKILTAIPIFLLFNYINCHCLLRNSIKCVIQENLADESWLKEICSQNSKLSIIGVIQNELKSYRTLEDYCKTGAIGRLSWINYTTIIEPLLNSKAVNMDLARVSRVLKDGKQKITTTEHAEETQILVENLPLRYELRNIQRTAWENVTKYENTILADIYLRNDGENGENSKIFTQNPIILTNHSIEHVFPSSVQKGSEMRLFEGEQVTRITVGRPRSLQEVKQTLRISKRLAAKTHTSVRVEGTRANIWFEITGDLTLVYSDFKEERKLKQGQVIETKIIDIQQIETPISRIAVSYDDGINKVEDPEVRKKIFNILAICSCVLFFGTAIIVFTDVTIKLMRTRKEKKKGKQEHTKINHEMI